MQVFKFGGASIESPERVGKVADIIQSYNTEPLLIVISAKGKTTNALELIAKAYYHNDKESALSQLNELKENHLNYATALLGELPTALEEQLKLYLTEIEWLLNEPPQRSFDYVYDQIVCIGEILSTCIISFYFKKLNIDCEWFDVRDIMKTDDTYRDATIFWDETQALAIKTFKPILDQGKCVLTQGFIGSTYENNSVTLGREGSDYTAAVFANMLDATSVSIWKDVPSLLNADPKIFPGTVPIERISYSEVIEMAYYGAQVIHPKTIKPLYSKNIPLHVKCFLDKTLPGTLIQNISEKINYPPLMVLKTNQVLLQVTTKDYSFITEDNLSKIYTLFHDCKLKINLIQNAAISFVACVDSHEDKIQTLLEALSTQYDVKRNENLFLFTVRHYTQDVLREELKNRTVLLTQKTRQTIQMVVK